MALVLRHIYGTISGKNSKGTKSIYTNIAFDAKICLIYPKFLRKKTKFHDECSLEALQCKSMDWFLYDKDLRHERVKLNSKCDLIFSCKKGRDHSQIPLLKLLQSWFKYLRESTRK